MSRPNIDKYFARMVLVVASRSTCLRRAVGCILVNSMNHILATGYNGVPRGQQHCNEEVDYAKAPHCEVLTHYPNACPGAEASSGTDLDKCYAVHAEQNALLQCSDVNKITTIYVTHEPCIACTKMFLNTSANRICYVDEYASNQVAISMKLWTDSGRIWCRSYPFKA